MWYNYAKTAATKKLRDYARDPLAAAARFDIVITLPGWVIGPNRLKRMRSEAFTGTNTLMIFLYQELNINVLKGIPPEEGPYNPGNLLHIDDCAECHMKALKVPISGKLQCFLMCTESPSGPKIDSAIDIVEREFPDEAKRQHPRAHYGKYPLYKGMAVPLTFEAGTIKMKNDTTATENGLLGRPFKTYEAAVIDFIGFLRDLEDDTASR